jgi:hypothetical protein
VSATPQVTLRTFRLADFERIISWVPTQQALHCHPMPCPRHRDGLNLSLLGAAHHP